LLQSFASRYDTIERLFVMQKILVGLAAASLAVPVIPTAAVARPHHHQYYKGKIWQDSHGRLRCKRPNGTTGLIIGAAGGALVGRAIDTHGERATGTILGAAAGALLGRHIERSNVRCR
jgi:outer membrane lipoprotein SlyB